MKTLKSNIIGIFILFMYAIQAPLTASQKEDISEKCYLYGEATDIYIRQIIDQSQRLLKAGDPNEAIALLLKEQARLDKKETKINLLSGQKYVQGKNGIILRIPIESKTEYPLINEGLIPRLPSPLILTLSTIRTKNGQCPLEILDYYEDIVNKYKGSDSSIVAASQTISILGFNDKSWEFANAALEIKEKEQVCLVFIRKYLSNCYAQSEITKDNVLICMRNLLNEKISEDIYKMYAFLDSQKQKMAEALFWEGCPQWTVYNIDNRFRQALSLRCDKNYKGAKMLYKSVLDRYKESNKEIYYNAQMLSLETDVEKVLVTGQGYEALKEIIDSYEDLLSSATEQATNARALQALGIILMEQDKQALDLIKSNELLPENFLKSTYLFEKLSPEQRMKFDEFCWFNCDMWHDYNYNRQHNYAITMYEQGKYAESLLYFKRITERYPDKISAGYVLENMKPLIRLGDTESFSAMFEKYGDIKTAQDLLSPDIVWLIQNGNSHHALGILETVKSMLKKEPLCPELMFYNAYGLLLEEKEEELDKTCNDLKTFYPQSLYLIKINYLLQQKKPLISAFKYTQKDTFSNLIAKAGQCFDSGNLEMAMGIYLRIFAEYKDRRDEASKACYLLGYYYLLAGEFDKANDVLTFMQKEYRNSIYAKDAETLITRIKDITSSI